MSNALKHYLDRLPAGERAAFALRAGTSYTTLRLAANGYKTDGKLQISPEFAARIEKADLTGTLKRQHMSPTCAVCPHACGSK